MVVVIAVATVTVGGMFVASRVTCRADPVVVKVVARFSTKAEVAPVASAAMAAAATSQKWPR